MPCSQPGRLWNIRFGQGGNGFRRQRIDADRAGDVFDALLTAILEGESQAVAYLLAHRSRDADTARLCQAFQARRDVHRIAEKIPVLDDYVAEVDPDTKQDAPVFRDTGIALDHSLLGLDGPAHRLDRAGEFDQQAVAGGLDDAATVPGKTRVDQIAPACFEPGERSFLIRPHQARIAGDIGGNNRNELPFESLSRCGA